MPLLGAGIAVVRSKDHFAARVHGDECVCNRRTPYGSAVAKRCGTGAAGPFWASHATQSAGPPIKTGRYLSHMVKKEERRARGPPLSCSVLRLLGSTDHFFLAAAFLAGRLAAAFFAGAFFAAAFLAGAFLAAAFFAGAFFAAAFLAGAFFAAAFFAATLCSFFLVRTS